MVDPVFANFKNRCLSIFTLRGKLNVNTKWTFFALVHKIEQIAHAMRLDGKERARRTLLARSGVGSETTRRRDLFAQIKPVKLDCQKRICLHAR